MPARSRSRRFVPVLDCLQSRLVPSGEGVVITPMDPVLLDAFDDTTSEVVITPMDPVLLCGDGLDPSDLPGWVTAAINAGDGLITS